MFPFTKKAEVPFAAVCQVISADDGIASQWTKLARLLGLSHSQIDVVRLECHNRPQLCQQSAAKVLSLWSTCGGTAHSSSLATLLSQAHGPTPSHVCCRAAFAKEQHKLR